MPRFVKTFLFWLLLATLPLQGFAAAMQLSCGPVTHPVSAPAAVAPMTHEHHHDAGAHPTTKAEAEPDQSDMSKHGGSSCSACLACCVAAVAIPSGGVIPPACSASAPAAAASHPLCADFIPGGLERPPKPITA
jgi:hypothetical protein